jgi:hypothetical protein
MTPITRAGLAKLQENAPGGMTIYDASPLPPVNVRAEQVHRIRQHLANLRASCGTSLDDIDLVSLSNAIDDLIALERELRDKP